MSAQDTLTKVIELEAGKLLARAQGPSSLSEDDLASLEALARSVRALRGAAPAKGAGEGDDSGDVNDLLAQAQKR